MKVSEIVKLINARVVTGDRLIDDISVDYAFASDLMSDVLTLDDSNVLLITGLANNQAIRTAEMSDIQVLILGRDKKASPEMIKLASDNELILLECPYTIFKISGELYAKGIKAIY